MQLIFGANGPSGRAYIRTLTDSADTVAVLRKPSEDSFFVEHNIQTVVADALDADALDKALAQYHPDTVISFVGGKNEEGIRSDALGNINIIAATKAANPQARFVLITSMGCGEQWDMMSEPFKQALGEAVRAKTEAEIYLKQSGLNWTILRPCGLADGEDNAYT
ncbi:MAG: NAD(P)H-binding protein, partial [Neisseria sp.]